MRRPNVFNVPIRVKISKPGGPLGCYGCTARIRVTPWGRFQLTCYDRSPHVARRFAQAGVLKLLSEAIYAHYLNRGAP